MRSMSDVELEGAVGGQSMTCILAGASTAALFVPGLQGWAMFAPALWGACAGGL